MPRPLTTFRTVRVDADSSNVQRVPIGAARVLQVISGARPGLYVSFRRPAASGYVLEHAFEANRDGERFPVHADDCFVTFPDDGSTDALELRAWPDDLLIPGQIPREHSGLEEEEAIARGRAVVVAALAGGPPGTPLHDEVAPLEEGDAISTNSYGSPLGPRFARFSTARIAIKHSGTSVTNKWISLCARHPEDPSGTQWEVWTTGVSRWLAVGNTTNQRSLNGISIPIPPGVYWQFTFGNNNVSVDATLDYVVSRCTHHSDR